MKITIKSDSNKKLIYVEGRIDTSNYSELERVLESLDYENDDITFDFSRVQYITSSGLRVLLICRRNTTQDKMHIINVNDPVYEVFETSGFLSMIDIRKADGLSETILQWSLKRVLAHRAQNDSLEPSVYFGDKGYTWKDIDIYSQIMADDMAKLGVKKGSHVGIASANCVEWICAFFAIQKLGAIAIFVNYNLKSEEILSLAAIGDIACLCYGILPGIKDRNKFVQNILQANGTIKKLYDMSPSAGILSRRDEYEQIADLYTEMYDPDDPSIMIFTSGSTSKPKGVLSSSYDHFVQTNEVNKVMKVTGEDRICCFLPLFHIFGFGCGLVSALIEGAGIYFPENSKVLSILDTIEKYKCTVFHSVPTMMLSIINHPDFSLQKVESLRVCYLGGAPVTEAQLLQLKENFVGTSIGIVYGMSEVAPISMTLLDDPVSRVVTTVGKPLKVIDCEIRDTETGKSLPKGERGEIFVRARTLLTCYYKLDIDSQAVCSDGWLATGDLGVIDDEGYLKLVGRKKDLIIRGGENIAPAEVERVISELDNIADVKVVGVYDHIYGEEVAAAILLKAGATFCEDEVREYLLTRLAKYKVPQYYVIYDKFPILGSGKIDVINLRKDVEKKLSKS